MRKDDRYSVDFKQLTSRFTLTRNKLSRYTVYEGYLHDTERPESPAQPRLNEVM